MVDGRQVVCCQIPDCKNIEHDIDNISNTMHLVSSNIIPNNY